ncbi:MAG: DUF4402 domain-containing protein [Bacteroidales bacterium]
MKRLITITFLAILVILSAKAQPTLPPRTLTVSATQPIHFGKFCVTGPGGGTVTVNWDGTRSATGSIALLPGEPTAQPAIFNTRICWGRRITLTYDPITLITGSGGGTMTMDIGPTEKGLNGASFISAGDCNSINIIRVGGTIHIPANAVPGFYSGSFTLTFSQN